MGINCAGLDIVNFARKWTGKGLQVRNDTKVMLCEEWLNYRVAVVHVTLSCREVAWLGPSSCWKRHLLQLHISAANSLLSITV
jgi:hypothetical protein